MSIAASLTAGKSSSPPMPKGDGLVPCLSRQLLNDIGVKLDSLVEPETMPGTCVDLPRLIPGALTQLDGGQLALSISIPQIAMRRDVAGYVNPDLWDYGINSAFVNYQFSAQQGRNQSGHNSSQDLYLNSGLNLGAWRLRSNNAFRSDAQGERTWSSAYTYIQRDLPGTHSQLTLGETFTPGDIFRSVPIKGRADCVGFEHAARLTAKLCTHRSRRGADPGQA
jgi:outer membrane usher protein